LIEIREILQYLLDALSPAGLFLADDVGELGAQLQGFGETAAFVGHLG